MVLGALRTLRSLRAAMRTSAGRSIGSGTFSRAAFSSTAFSTATTSFSTAATSFSTTTASTTATATRAALSIKFVIVRFTVRIGVRVAGRIAGGIARGVRVRVGVRVRFKSEEIFEISFCKACLHGNWSNKVSKDTCGVLTGIEVLLCAEVGFLLVNLLLDFNTMEKPVLSDGRGELLWLLEDSSPFLNAGHIIIETLAASDGVWEHPDDIANVSGTSNHLTTLDIVKSGLSVLDKRINILHASAEQVEVVVTGEAVDETGSEVRHEVQRRKGESVVDVDGSNSEGEQVSEVSS